MRDYRTQDRIREAVRREELLSTLSAVEDSLETPGAPRFGGARDLFHLEAALAAWIDAADAACGAHAVGEDQVSAVETLARFRSGQLEALATIRQLVSDADQTESAEEITHLNERAREAVGSAVRLQSRKQRFLARLLGGELGDGD